MTPSPAQQSPASGVQNFAPVAPLLKLRDTSTPRQSLVCDALKERFRHHRNLEKQTWNEIYAVGHLVGLFIEGQQILRRDPFDGRYVARPVPENSNLARRAVNLMGWYKTNQESKWLNSNPDVRVSPGGETDESQGAAKAAGVVVDHYEREFYGPWFNREEFLHAAQWGTYVERVRYTLDRTSGIYYRQLFEQSEVTLGPGYASCAECGKHGAYADYVKPLGVEGAEGETARVCPHCKSDAVFAIEPARDTFSKAAGREAVPFGDIVCEIVPITSLRWDLRKRLEESKWAIRRERTSLAAVMMKLGRVKLGGGGSSDAGLDIIDALAYAGASTDGKSTGGNKSSLYKEPVTADEYWLDPEDYCDINVRAEEQTVGGAALPAGNLAESFPDGLCVTGYNEMAVIDGIYGERHKPQFVSGVWHQRALSGAGRGSLADTVEVQKRFNTFDSDAVSFMGGTSTPATLYDKMAISREEAKHLFTPRASIGVDMTKLPQEVKQLAHAVHQLPPGSMPAQFLDYVYNRLSTFAQLTSGVTAFSDGIPGADNKTATGARIGAAMSDSVFAPPFLIKGEVRLGVAKRVVALYVKHFARVRREFPLAGRNGQQRFIYLAGADLNHALKYEVVEGSTLPRDSFFEQENRQVFYGLFGGFPVYMQAKKAFPAEVAELERVFNIRDGHSADDFDAVAMLCRRRLDQLKQAAGAVQDPMMLLTFIKPPVSTREPRHAEQKVWWQDWLVSDEGLDSPPQLRAAAELMVDTHAGSGTLQMAEQGFQQGVAEAAAQAPGAMGQQAMAEASAGQQQQQAQAELENQAAQVGLEGVRHQMKGAAQREQVGLRQGDREHALAVRKEAASLQGAQG